MRHPPSIGTLCLFLLGLGAACAGQGPTGAGQAGGAAGDTTGAFLGTPVAAATSTPTHAAPVQAATTGAAAAAGSATSTASYASIGLITEVRPGSNDVSVCTGTVVGRRTILTAAHCLLATDVNGQEQAQVADPTALAFHLGASLPSLAAPASTDNYYGVAIYLPGGATFPLATFIANLRSQTVSGDDLGLLEVDHDLNVPTLPVLTQPLTQAAIGSALDVPGYGSTGSYSALIDGQRRVANVAITSFDGTNITTQSTAQATHVICSGDSGAPALWANTIQGVVTSAHTDSGNCSGVSFLVRTDAWANFLLNPAS